MRLSKIRIGAIALELFVAVNAVAGSIYLFGGAPDWPRQWLRETPFDSWLIPGLILLLAVGGSMVAAAWAAWRRPGLGGRAALFAGLVLLIWITVESAMLGYVSWMQPATFVAALVTLALAWLLDRASGRARSARATPSH